MEVPPSHPPLNRMFFFVDILRVVRTSLVVLKGQTTYAYIGYGVVGRP